MYLQVSSVKADSRKHMEQPGVASFLSRHLSRYGNQQSQYHTDSLGSSSQSFNFKSLVPCFSNHSSFVCDFVRTPKQLNDRRMATYSDISSINILSYLVGGFVGSKSQIGISAMKGSNLQIWDIVMDKLYDMMNDHIVCSEDLDHQLANIENVSPSPKTEIECTKRTYASVIKMSPSMKPSDEYAESVMKFDNSRRTRRRGKRASSANTNDKKMNYLDKSYFNSSRWSNTRKKHSKKGAEKHNRREKMEAANDGIDFINQELDRDPQFNQNISFKRSSITDKIMENLQMKGVRASESTSSTPCRTNNSITSVTGINNSDSNHGKSNFDKEKDCDRQQLIACKMKVDCGDVSVKPRANSESSIESEDSFIVFEHTDADNLSCYSIESDDSSSESDDSDSDFCSACIFYANTKFNDANHSGSVPVFNKTMICLFCKKNQNEHFDFLHSCNSSKNSCSSPKPSHNRFLVECIPNERISSAFVDSEDRSQVPSTKLINSIPNSDDEDIPLCSAIDEESYLPTFDDPVSNIAAACDHDYQFSQLPSYEEHICTGNNHFKLLNKKWNQFFCDDNNNQDSQSSKNGKKVTFAPDDRLIRVRTMRVWDYALRSARIGPWEELARDSMRYCHRIARTEEILKPIFSDHHRKKIWHERFETQLSDSSKHSSD